MFSEFPKVMSERGSTESNRDSNDPGPIFQERSTHVDFDELKRRWKNCDRMLDTAVRLNARRLRSSILEDGARSSAETDYDEPIFVVHSRLQSGSRLLNWIRGFPSLVSDFES